MNICILQLLYCNVGKNIISELFFHETSRYLDSKDIELKAFLSLKTVVILLYIKRKTGLVVMYLEKLDLGIYSK